MYFLGAFVCSYDLRYMIVRNSVDQLKYTETISQNRKCSYIFKFCLAFANIIASHSTISSTHKMCHFANCLLTNSSLDTHYSQLSRGTEAYSSGHHERQRQRSIIFWQSWVLTLFYIIIYTYTCIHIYTKNVTDPASQTPGMS